MLLRTIVSVFLNLSCGLLILSQNVHFKVDFKNISKLPRFWVNTGFCPPAPTNSSALTNFFLSEQTIRNIEHISALPNNGLKAIRIHWLLNLIKFIGYDEKRFPRYDFTNLDKMLDHLSQIRLFPVIEFMGNPSNKVFNQKHASQKVLWKNLVYQIISRYIKRYGIRNIRRWKFETWNEPDLSHYNTLNYTFNDYTEYINGVWEGLDAAGRIDNGHKFLLSGPAGLFKDNKTHQLCWGLLDSCNANETACRIDILSYHRKGFGKAQEVIDESVELINDIHFKFPNLRKMKISNSEADPMSDWSKPLAMNADVEYAATLVNIVLLHWNAKYNKILDSLHSISHDNSFVSYHPFEFYQRTLMALFKMNNTNPVQSQFVRKPVYSALGMLSNLAPYASGLNNISMLGVKSLWTKSHQNDWLYLCGILSSESMNRKLKKLIIKATINVTGSHTSERYSGLIEYLENEVTDPAYIWKSIGRPAFPNATERELMRKSEGPHVLATPIDIHRSGNQLSIRLNATLKSPWILLIRICSEFLPKPSQITNVRIRRVNSNEVIIFWREKFTSSRCTKTYEIYFLPHGNTKSESNEWINITENQHVPFMSYHFQPDFSRNFSTQGRYKVRGIDAFGRKGKFSLITNFQ